MKKGPVLLLKDRPFLGALDRGGVPDSLWWRLPGSLN
jgi:hypothetical protein